MTTVRSTTITPSKDPQQVAVRAHTFTADTIESGDTGPGPHDLFDAALASCKSLTAHWYAKKHGLPLERVETTVESDNSGERVGKYKLRVHVTFHGAALTDEHRAQLTRAIAACPIHKLMTTADVEIEMVGLAVL
jgi:putative redox protein